MSWQSSEAPWRPRCEDFALVMQVNRGVLHHLNSQSSHYHFSTICIFLNLKNGSIYFLDLVF